MLRPLHDRLVEDAVRREHRDDDDAEGAQALGPRRPAEEQPPQEDSQPADRSRKHAQDRLFGRDDWEAESYQQLRYDDDHARPQSELLCTTLPAFLC